MSRISEVNTRADIVIGSKVKELRTIKGLSRGQLGVLIDVTHQQLSKYEDGTNRISAGRLISIATALEKPVSYFFEGLQEKVKEDVENDQLCLSLHRAFKKLDKIQKQSILDMVKIMGGDR